MDIETILEELEYLTGGFPHAAVKAAIAQQEAITPHLLQAIEDTTRELDELGVDYEYMLHIYAFYLLAQFRETRAYPVIVDFFSQPGEAASEAVGDFLTESLGQVLASVSGGDMTLMQQMVENPDIYEYTRAAALDGLVCLVANDLQPRDVVVTYFRDLFRGGLEREYSLMWDALVECTTNLYPEELLPDIQQAFADDLVDNFFIDWSEVETTLNKDKDVVLDELRQNWQYQLINDTISKIEWWHCFQPEQEMPSYPPLPSAREFTPPSPPQPPSPPSPQTPWIAPPKVGRNEPCPCGSGRKYKQCCLKKERT